MSSQRKTAYLLRNVAKHSMHACWCAGIKELSGVSSALLVLPECKCRKLGGVLYMPIGFKAGKHFNTIWSSQPNGNFLLFLAGYFIWYLERLQTAAPFRSKQREIYRLIQRTLNIILTNKPQKQLKGSRCFYTDGWFYGALVTINGRT